MLSTLLEGVTLFDEPVDTPAAPSEPLVRVRMLVAYDGSGFHGFAAQPGQRTVAGVLAEAIEKVARHPADLTCAGRTDRGVHAWGQVVSLDLPASVDLELAAALAGEAVRARRSSCARSAWPRPTSTPASRRPGRTYRYTVLNRPVPDPFLATTSWHVPVPLDLELLTLACDPFLGEHDFSAFCRRPKAAAGRRAGRRWCGGCAGPGGPTSATGCCASRSRPPPSATRWCARSSAPSSPPGHAQVRAGDIRAILQAGDRAAAAPIAPPEGLCLWHVSY